MNEFGSTLKIATVWLLLGLVVFLGFLWHQDRQRRLQFSAHDGVIEIRRANDGHYHWPGRLQGIEVDFLVDTGATGTAIPLALAERAGLTLGETVVSSTAGGRVQGRLARAEVRLDGGVQAQGLRVVVLPALEAPLLGMDLLGRLRLSQQGGVLRIEPPQR